MKYVKMILYLIALLAIMLVLVLGGTALAHLGLLLIVTKTGLEIEESIIDGLSGHFGVIIAGISFAVYSIKKKYALDVKTEKTFRITKEKITNIAGYTLLIICIDILLYSSTTFVFSGILPLAEKTTPQVDPLLNICMGILMAPVFEELLFRMGMYSSLRAKLGKCWSMCICSVMFAFLHGYQLQGFLSCLVFALLNTLVYEKTRNIIYCILIHICANLFTCCMNALERTNVTWLGVPVQYEINGYNTFHWILIAVAIIFCLCFTRKVLQDKDRLIRRKNVSNFSSGR